MELKETKKLIASKICNVVLQILYLYIAFKFVQFDMSIFIYLFILSFVLCITLHLYIDSKGKLA